jgi:hypothetical protein
MEIRSALYTLMSNSSVEQLRATTFRPPFSTPELLL